MPTYSYACTECDNRFDAVQAFTDDALTTCPKCDGEKRLMRLACRGDGFRERPRKFCKNAVVTAERLDEWNKEQEEKRKAARLQAKRQQRLFVEQQRILAEQQATREAKARKWTATTILDTNPC